MKRFENKVVAITGGGSGMGRVSSELFAQEGATVCVVDINGAAAQQTVDNILAAGGKAVAIITHDNLLAALAGDAVVELKG